jgi:cytochrome oxidase Cu insertion factor (SCO1/SenC/PrrC family)
MKECPVCGIRVKLENLEGHLKKVHPRAKVDAILTEEDKTDIKVAKKKIRKQASPFEEQERRKWTIAAVIIVIIIVALVFILTSLPPGGPGCDLEGEDAILFTRGDVEGNQYNLNAHIGPRPILIEFFYTECSACISMAPTMAALNAYYGYGEQVEFVTISSDNRDSVESVRGYMISHASNWTHIWDSNFNLATEYCSPGTPTFVLIDTDGNIAKWWYKTRSYDDMISIIDPVVQG